MREYQTVDEMAAIGGSAFREQITAAVVPSTRF
jgi:hypothetical protein